MTSRVTKDEIAIVNSGSRVIAGVLMELQQRLLSLVITKFTLTAHFVRLRIIDRIPMYIYYVINTTLIKDEYPYCKAGVGTVRKHPYDIHCVCSKIAVRVNAAYGSRGSVF